MFKARNLIRENIASLLPYSSARDEFSGIDGIFLDANENPFGEWNRYPDPHQKELKKKLSQLKTITSKKIFIGNGSDEIIDLALRIFCNPNQDKALTFSPTYGMYDVSAAINSVKLIKAPLTSNFQIDLNLFEERLKDDELKLIFICSPNNPTGNNIDITVIEKILTKFKGIVIIDEAYIDFSDAPSWLSVLNQFPNLVVSQTFSKAWGLAAARVGVCYASEEIIEIFNRVKPPYNVSSLNQKAAINALENYEIFQKNIQIIKEEREKLKIELIKIDFVLKTYPSEANFLLIKVTNANQVYNQLVNQRIITRNRATIVTNCLRISIGSPSENIQLLQALKKIEI